jgi:hypothetical protein
MQVTSFVQVWDELRADLPAAQPALETFLATGLADVQHVTGFASLSRDRAIRLVERLGSGGFLRRLEFVVKRPDKRGQPAAVYLLTEDGARILQLLGHAKARACNLKGDLPILHALAMTDIHLAARKSGVEIDTDRVLTFNTREIRPDHLVTLASGRKIIFEVEQSANIETLRRVTESLRHKQSFFETKAHAEVLPEVRMVLHMSRSSEQWDKTLTVWEKALEVVRQETAGGRLAFRLFAITRREFLDAPNWDEQRSLAWREFLPQRVKTMKEARAERPLPQWLENSPREQQLILLAYQQELMDHANKQDSQLGVNPFFLENMRIIYSASYDESAPLLEQVALPMRSLKLLGEYLTLMRLRKPLSGALHAMDTKTRWNPTMIMQRMQVTISVFLRQHGWRGDGPLQAFPAVSNWENRASEQFYVGVEIRNPFLLNLNGTREAEPTQDEVRRTEKALAWVLQSLFVYSVELGLGGAGVLGREAER